MVSDWWFPLDCQKAPTDSYKFFIAKAKKCLSSGKSMAAAIEAFWLSIQVSGR